MIALILRYRYALGLGALLVTFVLLKLPDLSLPYFWDELGVYAPGTLRMVDGGPSLLPASLDPEYSRGHPLLCYALYAAWMRLVGDGVVGAHSLSLLIACVTLVALYCLVAKVATRRAALLAVVLTSVQPIFYALSAMLLPEMLLAFLTVVAVWGLLSRRWWMYLTAAGAAVLTKESALAILPAACLYVATGQQIVQSLRRRGRLRSVALAAAPGVVFLAFLFVQKAQHGWYFFPLHVGFIELSPHQLGDAALRVSLDLFLRQGRWLVGAAALAGAAAAILRRKHSPRAMATVRAFGLVVFFAFLFACTNYYLARYFLYAVPFVTAGAAIAITALADMLQSQQLRAGFVWVVAAAGIALGATSMDCRSLRDAADMSYRHIVHSKVAALHWAQTQPWRASVVGANFPVFQALQDPRHGYVSQPWPYSENCAQTTHYAILWHGDETVPAPTGRPYRVVRQFRDVFSQVTIVVFE